MIVPVASVLGVGSFEMTTFVAVETVSKRTRESKRYSHDTPAIDLALTSLGMVTENDSRRLIFCGEWVETREGIVEMRGGCVDSGTAGSVVSSTPEPKPGDRNAPRSRITGPTLTWHPRSPRWAAGLRGHAGDSRGPRLPWSGRCAAPSPSQRALRTDGSEAGRRTRTYV